MEAGLDSLGAVELRNALGAKFGADLPATLTFDYPSISALAGFLAPQLPELAPAAGEESFSGATQPRAATDVAKELQQIVAGMLGAEVSPDQVSKVFLLNPTCHSTPRDVPWHPGQSNTPCRAQKDASGGSCKA
jgi:hypothetical protein